MKAKFISARDKHNRPLPERKSALKTVPKKGAASNFAAPSKSRKNLVEYGL